jgi:hypothetical protein
MGCAHHSLPPGSSALDQLADKEVEKWSHLEVVRSVVGSWSQSRLRSSFEGRGLPPLWRATLLSRDREAVRTDPGEVGAWTHRGISASGSVVQGRLILRNRHFNLGRQRFLKIQPEVSFASWQVAFQCTSGIRSDMGPAGEMPRRQGLWKTLRPGRPAGGLGSPC